jgi:hypothetical protein
VKRALLRQKSQQVPAADERRFSEVQEEHKAANQDGENQNVRNSSYSNQAVDPRYAAVV